MERKGEGGRCSHVICNEEEVQDSAIWSSCNLDTLNCELKFRENLSNIYREFTIALELYT